MANANEPPAANGRSYTCPFCAHSSQGDTLSCPACGAPIDVRAIVSPTRWTKVPGQKDMARYTFGASSCQIEGNYVPAADVKLAQGDGVYFSHHVLLWMDPTVHVGAMPLKGAFKRVLAGMPIVMTEARGPGRIAFSRDAPGELLALSLQKGEEVDVREHLFVLATHSVAYDWFKTDTWYQVRIQDGKDTKRETCYPVGMFMDRFSAPSGPGLLVIHASGNVFVRTLQPGQHILIKPTALLFKDPSVQMKLHFEHPNQTFSTYGGYAQRYTWLRLTGPGRVAAMSAFEPVEHESAQLLSYSAATETRW
jgi:uncharacterized protein (AIM24 family)